MKLRELNEDRNDDIEKRAKDNFIEDLIINLQKVLAKATPTTVTVPATTGSPAATGSPSTPAQPSSTQQATPPNNIAQQAAQTRQQKLKAGGQAAQTQMAQNSVTPPNNIAQQAAQTRQQKLAIAAKTAQAGMTPVRKPVVWKSGRNPTAPAVARENTTFDILNKIFESILNVNEVAPAPAQTTTTLSPNDLVTTSFIQQMNAPHIFKEIPQNVAKIREFANEIVKTYPVDGGKAAMEEMGKWAWETITAYKKSQRGFGRGQGVNTATTPAASPTATTPAQPTTATQPPTGQSGEVAAPQEIQQSKVGVRQINKLIPTLRKRDLLSVKKNVDNTLAGRGGTAVAPTAVAPTTAPAKDNIISMPKGKAGQVRASREGGVTPEEQAKFDQKVQAAMASQK